MHWKVGNFKITKIVEIEATGGTRFILPQATPSEIKKIPWLVPHFANDEGKLKLSVHALIVETPTHRIIVDTCIGNDKQNRDVPAWNNLQLPFLEALTKAGYPPDRIDTVICTHLHVDHVGWNTRLRDGQWVPTFKNARYLFGKAEYEYWKANAATASQRAVFADSVKPIVEAGLADLVASDHRLSDDLAMLPTPGHSPGHMSLHINSAGEQALLIGDVAHHPCQMAHLDWSALVDSDPVLSASTRRDLFSRFADTPVLVIGGHFNAGYIKRDGSSFRFVAA